MKTKIFISLFALYFLVACDFDWQPEKAKWWDVTFRIMGTITSSTDNSPVVAHVTLSAGISVVGRAYTDNEGHYTIECTSPWNTYMRESSAWLMIEATGYKIKSINYTDKNHVRLTEEWQIIDVQLEPESGGLR